MTTTQPDIFQQLQSDGGSDIDQMLDLIVDHFRQSRRAMELFEALKMRGRHRLGLPLIDGENDLPIADEVQQQLESGMLDACREAGALLIQDGKIGEGWMYLRPLAELDFANQLLAKVQITDDNYDEMVHVLLHEGVNVQRGFRAVLDHQGTCNSITLFDQAIAGRTKKDRQAAAGELLDHFYGELTGMVRDDIKQRDQDHPDAKNMDGSPQTLGEMVQSRKWLLQDGGYHLDTTHLSAVVRNSAVLDDPVAWQKARELVQYGRRLHHNFQYPGEEPFVDFYPAYGAYYDVLLGTNVDAGLKLFQRKAETVDSSQHGTSAVETYVDLLHRIGRHHEAVTAAVRLVPDDVPPQRIVPLLLEIAAQCDDQDVYPLIAEYCRGHNDLLGFAATLHAGGESSLRIRA